MEIAADEVERLLDTWPVARLATVAADGRPRVVPIVFAHSGGALWSPVDGKPKSGRELARVADVRRDSRVGLLLDHYDDRWERLWWLRVDGDARVVAPARGPEVDAAVAALRAKYPQYGTTPVLRAPPTILRIHPTKSRSWTASRDAVSRSLA